MPRLVRSCVFASVAAVVPALALATPATQPVPSTTRPSAVTTAPTSPDADFVTKAARDGLAEVTLGEMAATHAGSADVKKFAEMMVADHRAANSTLLAIGMSEHVSPPQDLDPKSQTLSDKLNALHGADFDRAYVPAAVDDHREDVAEYEAEVKDGKDPAVKAYATQTLVTLRHHLKMAETLNEGMNPVTRPTTRP